VALYAAERAREGESLSLARQIEEAGRRAGRRVDPGRYVDRIADLVARTDYRIAPAAVQVLGRLRTEGWRIGVLSNTVGEPGAALRPVAERLGLGGVVQSWVFSDQHPWTKPHPAIFHAALAQLGARPETTVHIGDSWFDIVGARQAGLRAAVLFTGLQRYGTRYQIHLGSPKRAEPEAEYRFARWEELPALLERLP
jgi:HAD superfamily hydrolase (TIGR01509 family)